MSKKLAVLLLLVGPIILASCGDNPLGPSDLEGEWRLQSFTRAGAATVVIEDPARFTVRFGADGTLALRADCNGCGGTYRLDGESLISGPFTCTLVLCAGPAGVDFVGILDGRSSLELDGGRLIASSERGSLVFER
jgi:heat shock protein HslJ